VSTLLRCFDCSTYRREEVVGSAHPQFIEQRINGSVDELQRIVGKDGDAHSTLIGGLLKRKSTLNDGCLKSKKSFQDYYCLKIKIHLVLSLKQFKIKMFQLFRFEFRC